MIVKCVANNISFITNEVVRKRVRRWFGSGEVYDDLEIGKEYSVHAVDYFDGGIFYYLHSVDISEHPYPYIAELFEVVDSSLPTDWEVSFYVEDGRKKFRRISFPEWANDDMFFEKLIDGETNYVSIYSAHRLSDSE